MMRKYTFLLIIQALIALSLASAHVYAVATDIIAMPSTDPLLTWMQAAGFPAWAGVVAWGVLKVVAEMKIISKKLEDFILQTERRLSRLEMRNVIDAPPKDY